METRTRDYLRFEEEERPIGVQIFGARPDRMAEAAALVSDIYQPDFVDINFGCPVKKVVSATGARAACAICWGWSSASCAPSRGATPLPVTAKIRSGFDEKTRDPVTIGLRCQDAGATVVTLHPRTRADMYSGQARWHEIAALADALDIPVVGNGDIKTGEDARRMQDETGCAGVMIARASHGSPWVFAGARAALDGKTLPPLPDTAQRLAICLEHAQNAVDFERDARKAVIEFRKHMGWYTRGLPNGRQLRTRLFRLTTLEETREVLEGYLEQELANAA